MAPLAVGGACLSLSVSARGRCIEGGGGRVRRGTDVTMVGLGRERDVDGIEVSR